MRITHVVEKIRDFRKIHETTLRSYIYELLTLLNEHELLQIIEKTEDYGVKKRAIQLISKN